MAENQLASNFKRYGRTRQWQLWKELSALRERKLEEYRHMSDGVTCNPTVGPSDYDENTMLNDNGNVCGNELDCSRNRTSLNDSNNFRGDMDDEDSGNEFGGSRNPTGLNDSNNFHGDMDEDGDEDEAEEAIGHAVGTYNTYANHKVDDKNDSEDGDDDMYSDDSENNEQLGSNDQNRFEGLDGGTGFNSEGGDITSEDDQDTVQDTNSDSNDQSHVGSEYDDQNHGFDRFYNFFGRNDNRDEDFDDPPLYFGAPITLSESLISIFTYVVTNNLTGSSFSKLLELISLHLPADSELKKTKYMFLKYFEDMQTPMNKHFYCSKCHSPVDNLIGLCDQCGTEKNTANYFIHLPIIDQLQKLLMRQDISEMLMHPYQRDMNENAALKTYYNTLLTKGNRVNEERDIGGKTFVLGKLNRLIEIPPSIQELIDTYLLTDNHNSIKVSTFHKLKKKNLLVHAQSYPRRTANLNHCIVIRCDNELEIGYAKTFVKICVCDTQRDCRLECEDAQYYVIFSRLELSRPFKVPLPFDENGEARRYIKIPYIYKVENVSDNDKLIRVDDITNKCFVIEQSETTYVAECSDTGAYDQ